MPRNPTAHSLLRVLSVAGWSGVALLDLWAGVDVFSTSDAGADASPVVDQLGRDSVVSSRYLSQPDLIALVIGLLVIVALVSQWALRGTKARRRLDRLLVLLGLTSVVVLALGGHWYALVIPVLVPIGTATTFIRSGTREAERVVAHVERPRPQPATAPTRPAPLTSAAAPRRRSSRPQAG